jgi:hypothetical protein
LKKEKQESAELREQIITLDLVKADLERKLALQLRETEASKTNYLNLQQVAKNFKRESLYT